MSRKPKSIEQHLREGTLNPTRHKGKTPLVVGGRKKPACPKYLTGHARTGFRMIVNDLWDSGILDAADRGLILTAASHFGNAVSAREDIDDRGVLVDVTRVTRSGETYETREPNAAVKIEREALFEYRLCCDALGIGPSARARLAHLGIKGKTPDQTVPGLAKFKAIQGGGGA